MPETTLMPTEISPEELADLQKNPRLRHTYANDYRTHLVSGAGLNVRGGRVELDFYADGTRLIDELLRKLPDDDKAFESTNLAQSETVREHLGVINITPQLAREIASLILDTLDNQA